MALPFPISNTQTDAKSPIDQQLMDAIRLDLDYLDNQIGGSGGGGATHFRVNGPIWQLKPLLSLGYGKKMDGAIVTAATTFSRCRLSILKGGTSGALEVDVLRHIAVNHPITKITAQYQGATQAVGRLGSPLNTQSVTIATPVINTQQITYYKAAVNVRSIVKIAGTNKWLYTFTGSTPLDSDYQIGDYIIFSGCTAGANNGEFQIVQVNYDGLPSVVVTNASGVEQVSPAGQGQLGAYSYEFLATVDDDFAVGEQVIMAGHSWGGNNGTKTIFKVNSGANNIVCKFQGGATQGAPAGTATVTRWVYTFVSPVDATSYVIGEKAEFAGHSSGANNGKFIIRRVNEAGNNIYVTNPAGVSQGGAAGTANTLRWLYNTPVDVSGDISVGDFVELTSHSNANNNGLFEVKFVNRFAANNIEIYNENGVTQTGVAGTITTALKVVWFETDLSAAYVAGTSKVLFEGLKSQTDNIANEFLVKEINRGGFTNYNIVVYAEYLSLQGGAAGRVAAEARSIFTTRPRIEVAQAGQVRNFQYADNATFAAGSIAADSLLSMDILEIPEGLPETILLSLS